MSVCADCGMKWSYFVRAMEIPMSHDRELCFFFFCDFSLYEQVVYTSYNTGYPLGFSSDSLIAFLLWLFE